MTQTQIASELGTAQIEIAVAELQILVLHLAVDREGRDFGTIQDFQSIHHDLYLARRQIGIGLTR